MFRAPSMFVTAPSSVSAAPPSDYITPTLNHGLRIWWAYYWPTMIVANILVYCTAYWLRIFYQNSVLSATAVIWTARLQPYVITALLGILAIYYVLHRNFLHFRIELRPRTAADAADKLPVTMARSMRVWWRFTWRTLAYLAVSFVIVMMPVSWFVGLFAPGPVFSSLFGLLLGLIVNGAISLFVIYANVLDEDFGDFTVRLVPREPAPAIPSATPAAPATPGAAAS
jgi:hypothetical protein